MNSNKQKTLNKIQELEQQLEVLKKDLKNQHPTIQEASIGDVLEDGSIVVDKTSTMALLAAPKTTEVRCQWTPEFQPVFDKLKEQGFIPSQWFVPSKEQLNLVYENCEQRFASNFYWSSSEVSSTGACNQGFRNGSIGSGAKTSALCVRAFRVVNF